MQTNYILGLSKEGFHRVVYTEWGENNEKRPIICVHGLTRNRHDFDALGNYLSEQGRHLFCPDMVGRGDSDWLKNSINYTYEQYCADSVALIARTAAHSIDWIGTSMGGLIGMVLASLPQTPIRSLILNDIGPHISRKAILRISKYTGKEPLFSSIDEAKIYFKMIYADFGNLTDDEWHTLTEHSIREVSPRKFTTNLDPAVKVAPSKSKLAWEVFMHPQKMWEGTLFDIDLWHIWHKITCPVLVIRGAKSDMLPISVVEKMKSTHPNVDVFEVANAGHAPLLLKQEQLEFIHQWLEKHG